MKFHPAVLWFAVAFGSLAINGAGAETLAQKAARDGVLFARKGDAQMNAAYAKAQQTLALFVAALDGKVPGARGFTVKVPVTDAGQTEFFWINELSHRGNQFTGKVNNRPEQVQNVQFGQTITFTASRIRDWGYYLDGKLQGNFTTCVLLGKEDPTEARELQRQIGLSCE
ncbi:hypothetical protein LMIY3S_04192 [Labrys miyagiensis]